MSGSTGEQDWYISGVFSMSFVNLTDTFADYIDRAGMVPKVNAAEDALVPSDTKIDAHADRHKDGGADELDVSDLAGAKGVSGQVPETDGAGVTWINLSHGNLSGVGYNDHHGVGTGIIWDVDNNVAHDSPAVHEAGGALEITHNNLALASDDHHAKYTDSEAIAAINNDADHGSTAQHNYFSGSHDDLSGVSYNDHHGVGTGIIWDVDNNIAHSPASVHESGGALEITHNNLVLAADDHHAKYTDAEAIAAINNDADHGSTAQHDYYTDSEAIDAINNDADHGSTAQHDYFSGSHQDLINLYTDDHHAKYTDAEAIAALEGNANVFTAQQEIQRIEDSDFLWLTDTDTGNIVHHHIAADGVFWTYGVRASDAAAFFFASFHPAAGYWELHDVIGVGQGALKTSSGSVAESSDKGANKTLPGGEYGFYPQLKHSLSDEVCHWGWDSYNDIGMEAATVGGNVYNTNIYICSGIDNETAYARQRYVTASGEIHWVFIQKDKISGRIKSVWQAPDHPCFGNGGNPSRLAHPFGDFDPAKHELIVINPSSNQVREINRALLDKDGMENGLDFIEAMFQLFDIIEDEKVKYPDIPVTVGLTSEYSDNPKQPVKKLVPACPYAKMGRLNVR